MSLYFTVVIYIEICHTVKQFIIIKVSCGWKQSLPWERIKATYMPSSLGSRFISVDRQVVSE